MSAETEENKEVDDFGSKDDEKDCEYFHMVIRPMLSPGHEGELCEWMKQMGLLRRGWRCSNEDCKGPRGYMTWNKARVVDKYNWACPNCTRKISIREGSFFVSIKCEFKLIFQTILGWCKREPAQTVSNNLGIKSHVVKRIYERCSEVASKYVQYHNHTWLLGGDDTVVVVDVYPDGYMTSVPLNGDGRRHGAKKKVLCIADTSCMPARIWATLLEQDLPDGSKPPHIVEETLGHLKQQVRPGSTLVINERAQCFPYDRVKDLKLYPSIISVETLIGLNLPGTRRVQENLETIWQTAVEVCEDVQEMTRKVAMHHLHEYMWRQLFAFSNSAALESILHHIADQYLNEE